MNGGQVIKEYAQKCGIDTISLDHRQPGKVLRAKKLKIPGKDISFPCHKTVPQVKEEWAKLIQQWVYSIGEQCAPKEVTTVTAKGGHIVKQQTTMYSRRIRLKEIRENLLQKHKLYMRLQTDQEIAVLTPQEAQSILTKLYEPISPNTPPDVLQAQIKTLQRSRHFCMWHDHIQFLAMVAYS